MLNVLLKQNTKFIPNYLPSQAHPEDAGWDLRADLEEPLRIYPGVVVKIPTGLSVALPPRENHFTPFVFEMQIRSRSGLAKKGLIVANSPGTVDAGYRGEICVLLTNISDEPITVNPEDRICQAVIGLAGIPTWIPINDLPEAPRDIKGFGSSGK